MKWKGAKETKSENIVAVKVLFPLCTAMVEGPEATDRRLTCCQQPNKHNWVFIPWNSASVFWEASTVCHNGRIIPKPISYSIQKSLECLEGNIHLW